MAQLRPQRSPYAVEPFFSFTYGGENPPSFLPVAPEARRRGLTRGGRDTRSPTRIPKRAGVGAKACSIRTIRRWSGRPFQEYRHGRLADSERHSPRHVVRTERAGRIRAAPEQGRQLHRRQFRACRRDLLRRRTGIAAWADGRRKLSFLFQHLVRQRGPGCGELAGPVGGAVHAGRRQTGRACALTRIDAFQTASGGSAHADGGRSSGRATASTRRTCGARMIAHNLPRPGALPPKAALAACSSHQSGDIHANTENQIFVDKYPSAASSLTTGGWTLTGITTRPMPHTGTWEVDRPFPGGLRPISDHAHAKTSTSLYGSSRNASPPTPG